ncbi:MAG: diacylglycerol kinase family lipid kinase [Muribaculaceae bacterium]|nr:diacylglycerol kinase family lipid kinase [Muribaculaceae bacterium]
MNRLTATLIINPISGTRSHRSLPRLVSRKLEDLGYQVEIAQTEAHGDATRLAADAAARGRDLVIAAGGDGTVNETAAALCGTKTALAILPCGSGNGLARHLDIPIDPVLALDIIADGRILATDYGTVNGDHKFFCTFGVGFDAAVSHTFAGQRRRGRLSYIKSAVEEVLRFRPEDSTIEAAGQIITRRAFLVAVCNASQYGNNAYIAPAASIDDGLLDITIIHSGNPIQTALVGVDIMTGYLNHNTLIQTLKARRVTITRNNDGLAHIDGDPITMGRRLDIECHHNQLRVMVPVGPEMRVTPIITPVRSFINDMRITINHLFAD